MAEFKAVKAPFSASRDGLGSDTGAQLVDGRGRSVSTAIL